MIVLYNIVQLSALLLLFPVLLPVALLARKYRGSVCGRLGFGLRTLLPGKMAKKQCIWVHALSVGEVRSCKPLLTALRKQFPDSILLLSTTTATGRKMAGGFGSLVDAIIPFPYDLWFSVVHFIKVIRPDFFVLVETDFWPNFLFRLQRLGVPAFLVNGRISAKSSTAFIHHKRLFLPVFSSFNRLYMQTAGHADTMLRLGVAKEKVRCVGNLKYDAALGYSKTEAAVQGRGPVEKREGSLLVAGSTHAGEEELLFRFFVKLRSHFIDAVLVVAPRDIGRAGRIAELARAHHLACALGSDGRVAGSYQVLVLDTLGQLTSWYSRSDIAFIGGSLVREGGHNPLEAAVFGKPVLFGPHMDDFCEISEDLLHAGGAIEVHGEDDMLAVTTELLMDRDRRRRAGQSAYALVCSNCGAAAAIAADMRMVPAAGRQPAVSGP